MSITRKDIVELPDLTDDIDDLKGIALRLHRDHSNLVREYNYLADAFDRAKEEYQSMLEQYRIESTKTNKFHYLLNETRDHVAMMFRKKTIKDVRWFNDILTKYEEIGGFIRPIKSQDYYTARAVINIDGMYHGSEHNIDDLKNNLIDTIMGNSKSTMIQVDTILIEDMYDVEEISDTQEG